MRRIAAVTATAVALGAGMTLAAAPASAAPANAKKVTKNWVTNKGSKAIFRAVKGGGKFTYNTKTKKFVVRGYIQDFAKNGTAPGIQFRVWRDGQWHESKVLFVTSNYSTPIDGVYKFNSKEALWTTTGTKLQVREGALKITADLKGAKYGAWKKLR